MFEIKLPPTRPHSNSPALNQFILARFGLSIEHANSDALMDLFIHSFNPDYSFISQTKVASPAYKLLLRSNLRNIREADLEYTVC